MLAGLSQPQRLTVLIGARTPAAALVTGLLNVVVKGDGVTPWTASGLVVVLVGSVLAVVAASRPLPVRLTS